VQTLVVFSPQYVEDGAQDEMKIGLRDEDKKWFSEEIGRQITAALPAAVDSLKPRGWRRATSWVREWGPSAIIVAVPVALLAIIVTLGIFAGNLIKDNARFQGETTARLNGIDDKLRELRAAQSPDKVLKELTTFTPPQLAQNLPALRIVSEQPIDRVNPSPVALKDVAYKLRDIDQNAEGYWPAVLKFLQFASAGLSPRGSSASGPRLTISQLTATGDIYNSTIVLSDGVRLKNVRFINCRIIFTTDPVEMENVQFINSAFEFPPSAEPSPYIKKAAHLLLTADNLETVSLDLSATSS
jgi:hypothetical protein